MKSIQISNPHYQMLMEVAKRSKLKPQQYVEEMIQVQFNKK